MSTETNTTLIERHYAEIWNAHNPDATNRYYASGMIDHNPPMPGLPTGREGARAIFATFIGAFPDIRFTLDVLVAEDDMVTCRWTSAGTHNGPLFMMSPTGRQVTVTGIDLFRISNGKIVEHWGNFDQCGLLQQLGVIPSLS